MLGKTGRFFGEFVGEVVGEFLLCALAVGLLLGVVFLGAAAYAASPVGALAGGAGLLALAGYGGVQYARGPGRRQGWLAGTALAVFVALAGGAGLVTYCGCWQLLG
ncbi:hypothetical protein HHL19_00945 [Streptomyces sp. R302]|uniref:hypothetical protein n=1 Tax=unclassified Streptomyces TaxID=2593676 RepID=UPI00145DF7B0|nr:MULTISPECIES: hypothetical protein [unclassified Streptomyces]NML48935.1 hypothetical protein [Streptomyces sp. R301]NML77262.1 hypothetical protein [Streptomyces sp. R302]